jgi:hypothetical protein
MDPDKCLLDILELLDGCHGTDEEAKVRHRAEAVDRLGDLAAWLKKGGFPPNIKNVLERL